jgi:hypothetical protein
MTILKVAALGVDVLILVAVGSYFLLEGFGRNIAVEIFLALIAVASLIILAGAIREIRQRPQENRNVT